MIYGVFYWPRESDEFRNFWVVFRNCERWSTCGQSSDWLQSADFVVEVAF
jgi:hypothetical protein